MVDFSREGALIGDRERADLLDFVAEELDTIRMLGGGREDIHDAAADGELSAARHHVHAQIGELDEASHDRVELGAPAPGPQLEHAGGGQTGRDRLQGAADGCRHDQGGIARELGEQAKHFQSPPDRFGTGTQPFVRERFPRGEVHDGGRRDESGQRIAEALRAPTGRGDREEDGRVSGRNAALEQCGQNGSVEPSNDREVGVGEGRGMRVLERFCLHEGAHDPGNCHRMSLRTSHRHAPVPLSAVPRMGP